MKKQTWIYSLLFLFVGISAPTFAQDGSLTPKYSNAFLQIGVGARALGMGNAMVAEVNDVTASYWNPAGLTGVEDKLQVSLMHSEYFGGIAKYDYVGLAHKIDDKSAIGFAAVRFGVDNIPNTTQLIDNEGHFDYDKITLFTAADYGFLFSYGRKLGIKGLSVGGTAKVIYRHAGDFAKSWGFGIDAGLQYSVNKWRFGAMARDITSTFNAWFYNLDDKTREVFMQTGNEIPKNGLELTLPRLILGAKRHIDIGWQNISISPEVDLAVTTDRMRNTLIRSKVFSVDPYAGIEIGWKNIVAIRTGFNNFQYETNYDGSKSLIFQPNIGIGVTFKGVTLDYAFTNLGGMEEAMYSHVISLKIKINWKDKK